MEDSIESTRFTLGYEVSTVSCLKLWKADQPHPLGLAGLSTIAMTLDFTFTHEGRLKIGESSLTPINEQSPPPSPVSSESSTSSNVPPHESVAERSLPPWALDTLEVCSTLRGIGWKFGKGVYVPPETRPLQRDTFMRTSIISFIKNYLILDLCLVVFKSFPGIGTPLGGSIYLSGLPLFHRHTVALLLSIFSGFTLISGFNVLNGAATLAGVGLLRQSPTQWPPIIDNPWAADSLHDFWTRRWHQTLRRTFLVLGGFAGQCFAGQPGLILGAFLASGLFHEGGTYLLGRGVDHRVTLFFVLQGVGVLIEKMYKSWTGRRWGGVVGRVWTYFFVMGLGQLACECADLPGTILRLILSKWIRGSNVVSQAARSFLLLPVHLPPLFFLFCVP